MPDEGASQHTVREPPPPGVIDLGNGEVDLPWGGTADLFLAAADWLHRNYPDGVVGESYATGQEPVILNMSNYRVRQVLALGRMPERQRLFLIALATWMTDDTRVVTVAYEQVMRDTGQARNTVKAARRELEAAKRLASDPGGKYRGDRTVWTVLCLPETAGPEKGASDVDPLTPVDNSGKGVSDVNPVSDVDPLPDVKGVKDSPVRGSNDPGKGGQSERADLREPDAGLNHRANTSGSLLSPRAREAATTAPSTAGREEREADVIEGKITRAPGGATPLAERIAAAVPGASLEDAEALIAIARRNPKVRHPAAWLQAAIDNGTIADLMADEAASAQLAAELFGPRPASPPSQAADVRETGVPETRTSVRPADFAEPQAPPWKTVTCPVCKAGPGAFCVNPANGGATSLHRERHRVAREQSEEATAQ